MLTQPSDKFLAPNSNQQNMRNGYLYTPSNICHQDNCRRKTLRIFQTLIPKLPGNCLSTLLEYAHFSEFTLS